MTVAPLLVTTDALLCDRVQRLAAAAGVVIEVADDVSAAQRGWSAAALVLVGGDLAEPLSHTRPTRRRGVHVVVSGPVPDAMFRSAMHLGAESLAQLPESDAWLIELLTDTSDGAAAPGRVIGVLPGSGGAGATTFAVALAQVLAGHGPTLLVDADPLGAGVDRVLGMDAATGTRWDALHSTTGRLSARALRESLPRQRDLAVLTFAGDRVGGLQPFAVREVLSAGARGHHAVVLDLPRHPDPVTDEVLTRCDELVLITTDRVPAVCAASRTARRLRELGARTQVVVRGAAGVPAEDIARLLTLQLATTMSPQRGLDEAIDLGAGPLRYKRGPLARAARLVAGSLLDELRSAA